MSSNPGWQVAVRCPHGRPYLVPLDITGRPMTPNQCPHPLVTKPAGPEPPKPGRLRVWIEAKRFRRWLNREFE